MTNREHGELDAEDCSCGAGPTHRMGHRRLPVCAEAAMNSEHGDLLGRLRRKQVLHLGPPRGRVEASLLNPDGPAAADLIESLSLRMRGMEEALAKCAEPHRWHAPCPSCGPKIVEQGCYIARAALTDRTGELVAQVLDDLKSARANVVAAKGLSALTYLDDAVEGVESLSLRMRGMEEALRQIAEERVWGLEITTEDLRDIARAALTQ